MELTDELKEKLAACADAEEAKAVCAEAGVELTDEVLEQIAGGRMLEQSGSDARGRGGYTPRFLA